MDNVFVERLWRTVKYEDVYLKDYGNILECRKGLGEFFERYNNHREHQSIEYRYPKEVYLNQLTVAKAA